MTIDERLDRIEHVSAGIDEERRKDREEYKALWRDTQRQLNEVSVRLVQLSETDSRLEALIEQLAKETRETITHLAQESRAANKLLEERIASMTSGMGELIRLMSKPKE